MLRHKRTLLLGAVPIAIFGLTAAVMQGVNAVGTTFFERGKQVVATLDKAAKAAKSRDFSALDGYYAADFHGAPLGLNQRTTVAKRDAVVEEAFSASTASSDRSAALAEWRRYLDSFDSIDELGLHLHRLEAWRSTSDIEAQVRFEVIGTPHGARNARIDRAYFRMSFREAGGALQIKSASLISGDRTGSDTPQFTDVSHQAGIDFTNRYYPAFLAQKLKFGMIRYGPAGITAVDYDNDGYYDLFIPDGAESKLFRNRGDGTFEDVTAKAGLTGLDGVSVAVFADYDNDGYKDVFVSRTFKHNQLFHNNGDGTFTDVTAKSGIAEDCCTTVAAWADYDNDGKLDLYVGRYLDPRKEIPTTFYARNGLGNVLYHNNGDGTFTDVTAKAGVADKGLCLGVVFGDYNDDGRPDIFVVNDFGRKTLFRNNGDGTFTDVTVKSGTLAYGAGMSASMADYDNDGKLDLYCTNIRSEHAWYAQWPTVSRYMANCWRQGVWRSDMPLYMEVMKQSGTDFVGVFQQMASGNTLLRNKGDGTFEDTTERASANPVGWFWGASFADFDNDGWQDIYAADGWVYNDKDSEIELDFLNNVVSEQKTYKTGLFFDPNYFGRRSWHGWEHNRFLHNRGDGTFEELGRATGTDLLTNSRGVAVADFWNRGVMDIAVSASTDKHALLRNDLASQRNWLEVELVGTKSNRDAVGARVTAHVKDKQQMREVVLGDGYGSQNSLRQHFGLGDATSVSELVVHWPRSGITQRFEGVPANRIVQITEGNNSLVEKHYGKPGGHSKAGR